MASLVRLGRLGQCTCRILRTLNKTQPKALPAFSCSRRLISTTKKNKDSAIVSENVEIPPEKTEEKLENLEEKDEVIYLSVYEL